MFRNLKKLYKTTAEFPSSRNMTAGNNPKKIVYVPYFSAKSNEYPIYEYELTDFCPEEIAKAFEYGKPGTPLGNFIQSYVHQHANGNENRELLINDIAIKLHPHLKLETMAAPDVDGLCAYNVFLDLKDIKDFLRLCIDDSVLKTH
ncbi:hypothetical protein [uncultured Sutterella sp.]|uniref:hypothetical protein n=1 Tax=uncultured Sutterella sp. TaxID=286133 RepID=UPI00261473D5|nr:hypothetical protein [uncultured Sutterella sp.]